MRIQRHQNGAGDGHRKLHHRPFDAILREQRDVLARSDAELEETSRKRPRLLPPLGVGELAARVRECERSLRGPLPCLNRQHLADGEVLETFHAALPCVAHSPHRPLGQRIPRHRAGIVDGITKWGLLVARIADNQRHATGGTRHVGHELPRKRQSAEEQPGERKRRCPACHANTRE